MKLSDKKLKILISIVINLFIIIFGIVGFIMGYFHWRWKLLTFYTEFSNFFAIITALLMFMCQINHYRDGTKIPYIAKLLKYFSTCCLTLTFFVVLFILAPGSGKGGFSLMFLQGSSLFFHFLNPIFSMVSFMFFEKEPKLKQNAPQLALLPSTFYAFVMYPLIVLEKAPAPYPFLNVYSQPLYMSVIWFLILLGSAYVFNFAVYLASGNDYVKNKKR